MGKGFYIGSIAEKGMAPDELMFSLYGRRRDY